MLDYRYILEKLYEFRGKKSGKNWLIYIDELEGSAPREKYVELNPYLNLIKIKNLLIKNKDKVLHSSFLRTHIEVGIKQYDDLYIGNIDNLLYLIDFFSEDENYKDDILLKELKAIFFTQEKKYL